MDTQQTNDIPRSKWLSNFFKRIAIFQKELFEAQEQYCPELQFTPPLMKVINVLESVRLNDYWHSYRAVGRPSSDRKALASAFIAECVLNLATTRMLIDRLNVDDGLRRICGYRRRSEIPNESTFSRAFSEFAEEDIFQKLHRALI